MKLSRPLLIALNLAALLLAFILIWPVIQMLLSSFTTDINFPPQNFTLNAFRMVVWPSFFLSIRFSLELGLWTTILLLLICLPAAYIMERRRFPGRNLLSVLIFVPTIFPGVTYVTAIGIYVAIFFPGVRGTFPIILLGTAMSAIPLVVRALQASIATTDPVYEEAAVVMGAHPLYTFVRVTLPLIGPGLVTAAMIAFTAAAMSFAPAFILGSGQPTAALFIFREVNKVGFTPGVAVMVLVIQAVVIGIVQTLYFVFRKQFRGLFV
jgi:putative spermidine/putrescine transport system permease protein